MRTVLSLTAVEVKNYFLQEENYHNFELPLYFEFHDLLLELDREVRSKGYDSGKILGWRPDNEEGVNCIIFNNKDGRYAWRPFELINPLIYVAIVNELTKEESWKEVCSELNKIYRDSKVECVSLPVVPSEGESAKAAQIVGSFYKEFEQKSMEYSLAYKKMLKLDIENCYGALYTHIIPRVMYGKKKAKKEHRLNKSFNTIDRLVCCTQFGQTKGIPQGSTLMDFLAEIMLASFDKELTEELKKSGLIKNGYRILRYRDDYRVFVNDDATADKIVKILSSLLAGYRISLNSEKTALTNNVICGSIKEGKLAWLTSYSASLNAATTLQKQLLVIKQFAEKYPNDGYLKKIFYDLHYSLDACKGKPCRKLVGNNEVEIFARANFGNNSFHNNLADERIGVLVAIVTDILCKNPIVGPVALGVLSILFSQSSAADKNAIKQSIHKINESYNNEYIKIWLQRIMIKRDIYKEEKSIFKSNALVKSVDKRKNKKIWEVNWIEDTRVRAIIEKAEVINAEKLGSMNEYSSAKEFELFASRRFSDE